MSCGFNDNKANQKKMFAVNIRKQWRMNSYTLCIRETQFPIYAIPVIPVIVVMDVSPIDSHNAKSHFLSYIMVKQQSGSKFSEHFCVWDQLPHQIQLEHLMRVHCFSFNNVLKRVVRARGACLFAYAALGDAATPPVNMTSPFTLYCLGPRI